MIPVKKIWRQFRIIGRIDDFECEISAELNFHIEMRTLDNIEAGMLPEAAREDALKRFGDVQEVRDDCLRTLRGSLSERLDKSIRPYLWMPLYCGLILRVAGHMWFPGNPSQAIQHIGEILIVISLLAYLFLFLKTRNTVSHQRLSQKESGPKKSVIFGDRD